MPKVLYRNTRIVDCDGEREGDVLVQEGVIKKIAPSITCEGATVIEAGGKTLLPGFVDLHAHFRDPGLTHKEDIETGCRAAVHGGYTTVHLMGNTKPISSSPEVIRYVREKAAQAGLCEVYQVMSITENFDGKTLSHLDKIEESVKWLSDDGVGVVDTGVMLQAMEIAKEKGVGLMLHEEDPALTKRNSYLMEDIPTYRDVELAWLTGCKVHFCHVSTIGSMNHIRYGKEKGADITCEVTPHHLYLNDRNPGRVAPPLRGEEHRRYLIECVKEGLVDAISTDHAPHTPEEKAAGMNGFTGLDTSFATCYTVLVRGGHIGLPQLSRLLSRNPAKLLGLDKGKIKEGMPADLVLVDTEAAYVVEESVFHSKSKNSPILGETLYGEVLMTMKEGKVVYEKDAH